MVSDLRQVRLHGAAMSALAAERAILTALPVYRSAAGADPACSAAFDHAGTLAKDHASALEAYVAGDTSPATGHPERIVLGLARTAEADASGDADALLAAHALLSSASASYGSLFEHALRLYEPPLRQLATRCIKEYAGAAAGFAALMAQAVSEALVQEDLGCQCICPMCGIGACGCVALAQQTLGAAVGAPLGDPPAGFPLQAPRAGSPLADAGVKGGERLFEIDGQPVTDIPAIQAAIRKHALGEEVRMLVGSDPGHAREVRVKHVSDYPGG